MKPIIVLCAALAAIAAGQYWTGPFQLTTSTADDINPATCKEWLVGNMTCLVWQTNRNGNWDITSRFCTYYGGNGWGAEEPVSLDSSDDVNPAVACLNDWQDHPSYWCVWERREGPVTGRVMASFITFRDQWRPPVDLGRTLHDTGGDSAEPGIITIRNTEHETVWVAWRNRDTSGSYVSYTFHAGDTWQPEMFAFGFPGDFRHLRLGRGTVPGQPWTACPLLVWEREGDIYCSRYLDSAWTQPEPVAPSAAYDFEPDVVSQGGLSETPGFITWTSTREQDTAVYGTAGDTFSVARRWCDTAQAGANRAPAATPVDYPVDDHARRAAVWQTNRNGNWDIYSRVYMPDRDIWVDRDLADDIHPALTTFYLVMHWCLWQTNRTGNWDIFGSFIYVNGVEERQVASSRGSGTPTIVRSVLWLPRDTGLGKRSGLSDNPGMSRAVLLDIGGRKVLDLHSGPNDVRHLAPGAYFLRAVPSVAGHGRSTVSRVVIVH